MYKRKRSSKSSKRPSRFPSSTYGKLYLPRGNEYSTTWFGPSYAEANEQQRANRKQTGFRGRGAYWGRVLGGAAGRAIGSRVGLGDAGAAIGSHYGDIGSTWLQNKITGRGAYSTNNLINTKRHARRVSSTMDESGAVVISHREYIQDLVTSSTLPAGAFQTLFFCAINPGLALMFPWLSQMAQFFEEYELIQLIFEYKSMVTEGNNTASGTVIAATQYNPTNAAFLSKQNMENYEHANSVKVTENFIHGVECDPAKNGGNAIEYIRTSTNIPTGQDPKTFDLGVFQIAANGCPQNFALGELWVQYKVKLRKAKVTLPSANPAAINNTLAIWAGAGSSIYCSSIFGQISATPTNTPLRAVDMFTTFTDTSNGAATFTFGAYSAAGCSCTFTFPPWVNDGIYMFRQCIYGKATALTQGGFDFGTSATNCKIGQFSGETYTDENTTNNTFVWSFPVRVTSPTGTVASFTLTSSTFTSSSATNFYMTINQMPYNLAIMSGW
nr:capsid protein [Cressdnaviricota sp.]